MDTELLRVTRRQIAQLREKLSQRPSPDSILEMSASLRQLLIDKNGLLRTAWNEVSDAGGFDKDLQIAGNYLDEVLKLPQYQRQGVVTFAVAGNAMFDGNAIGPVLFTEEVLEIDELRQQMELMYNNYRTHRKLGLYLQSVSIFFNGLSADRREVIQYAANKRGGIHYDKTRDQKTMDLHRFLDTAFDFYVSHPQGSNLPFFIGPGANGLHIALLAIAREIVESEDVIKLVDFIDSRVPSDKGFGFSS